MVRWRSLVVVLLMAGGVYSAAPAQAAGAHRALVVVDTGSTTYRQVITFTEDSVTGVHALELAGANPIIYTYSGQGGAVCRLFEVGRDAGPGCLGGADGDNRYWAYSRAPSGTSSFTYSRAGAGSVQVHDGDVEGWKFGTGESPAWSAVPPPSTTTTVAPAPPPTVPPTVGGSGQGLTGAGPGPVTAGGSGSAPAPVPPGAVDPNALGSTTTTAVPAIAGTKPKTSVKGKDVSKRSTGRVASGAVSSSSGGDGGGAGSLAWFALVAVALGAGVVYLRRMRNARGG